MIFIFLILTLLPGLSQYCEPDQITIKDACEHQYTWKNNQCGYNATSKAGGNSNYCKDMAKNVCVTDSSCAWNGQCENFVGCNAYLSDSGDCSSDVSINCNSIFGQSVCINKPSGCSSMSWNDCGTLDHKYGSRYSCSWNASIGQCAFKGCQAANLTEYSTKNCKTFYSICQFTGTACSEKLPLCSEVSTDKCQNTTASTGKCKIVNNQCVAKSCYEYAGQSKQVCNKYFNSKGVQCLYDEKVGPICLEPDYRIDVENCFNKQKLQINCSQNPNETLTLWDCFHGNGASNLNLCYSACLNNDNYCSSLYSCQKNDAYCSIQNGQCQLTKDCQSMAIEKCDLAPCFKNDTTKMKECSSIIEAGQCNKNVLSPQLRQCYWNWNNQSCETFFYCSQLGTNVTNDTCIGYGCKFVADKTYCIEDMDCSFYNQEQCTFEYYSSLSKRCVWENGYCRGSNCGDLKDQCEQYDDCILTSDKKYCKNKKDAVCSELTKDNCDKAHCVVVDDLCVTVNQYNVETILKNSTTDCKKYSKNLVSNGRSCILLTNCEKLSLKDCDGIYDIQERYCVESNSKCQAFSNCQQIKKQTSKDCYKISNDCSTDGKTCIDAAEQCSYYTTKESCHFQSDSTKCVWNNNNECIVMECIDLEATRKGCDSRKLCMDPSLCYPNQCIFNQKGNVSTCSELKSKCHYYSEDDCTKSVEGYCFWNQVNCQQLIDCSQIRLEEICTQGYLQNYCQYKKNQCENVSCQNSDHSIIRSLGDYFYCSNTLNTTDLCNELDGMVYNKTQCYSCQNQTYSFYCQGVNQRPLKAEARKLYY